MLETIIRETAYHIAELVSDDVGPVSDAVRAEIERIVREQFLRYAAEAKP